MAEKKKTLGKGLSALISDETKASLGQGYIPALPIELVHPNPHQPRVEINPEKLVELADSIREHGIIEPLIVTKKSDRNYELIAGERRLQASKLAGLEFVPVVVKEASPQQMLELAIVENIQRADLNALEEGLAFNQLVSMYNLSHEEISKKVGLSRPAVANKIRLLGLPEELKKGLIQGLISEGHARALLGLDNSETMQAAYKIIIRDGLSVRAVEELVRRLNNGNKKKPQKNNRIVDEKTQIIEEQLQSLFGNKTKLSRSLRGGKITIPFGSDKELEQILEKLN